MKPGEEEEEYVARPEMEKKREERTSPRDSGMIASLLK
jgi:hypothetical protein